MAGKFPRKQVSELLAECHRRCCICHRFCGVKIETDHIAQPNEGGTDEIENAIPVCFECHAEIHSYNPTHPRGRKFTGDELRKHKEQWLEICHTRPEVFVNAPRDADVGPLQALIDELQFNATAAKYSDPGTLGCLLRDKQFQRAIQEGAIATLRDELRSSILEAYVAMGAANQQISSISAQQKGSNSWAEAVNAAAEKIRQAKPKVEEAKTALLKFLGSEEREHQ